MIAVTPNNGKSPPVLRLVMGVLFFRPWLASLDFNTFSFLDRLKLVGSDVILETTVMGYVDAALLCLLLLFLLRNRKQLSGMPFIIPLLFFVAFTSINALIFSIDRGTSLRKLSKVYLYVTHLAIFYLLANDKRNVTFLRAVLFSAMFPVVYGWFDFLVNSDLGLGTLLSREYREYSTFSHANSYAFFLSAVGISAISLYFLDPKRRTRYVGAIVVIFASLLTTGARMAMAAFIFAQVISFSGFKKKIILYMGIAVILLLNIDLYAKTFSAVLTAVPDLVNGNVSEALQTAGSDILSIPENEIYVNEFASRFLIWGRLLDGLSDNYLWGMGLFAANKFYAINYGDNYNPHNDYIRLLFELGVVGSLLYFGFFGLVFFKLMTRSNMNKGKYDYHIRSLIAFIPFMGLVSLTDNIFLDPSFGLILFCVMGILLRILSNTEG